MLTHSVPHPEYRLVTCRSIPQMSDRAKQYSTYQWHGLLKHLRQMLVAAAPMEEGKYHHVFGTSVFVLMLIP